jgi:tRNA 2-thiouridine synthesizing protein A
MGHAILDTSGLTCPLPVLKARKALAALSPGDVLDVIATDPQSPADFEVLCSVGGHKLRAQSTAGGVFRFTIERG